MIEISQEVSRAHSTQRSPFERNPKLRSPMRKERICQEKLHPQYAVGFIEGEGSFSVSINRNRTLCRGVEVRPEFEIELRADDRELLERILITIGCGKIYDCSYDRYGWYPHVKYKVMSVKEMKQFLLPFLDRYPLQGKKAKVYALFRKIVLMVEKKEHLTDQGFEKIQQLRNQMRKFGKKHRDESSILTETARIRENRSSGGVGRIKRS